MIQRTINGIGGNFKPLDAAINDNVIPALLGRAVSPLEREIIALPVRFEGLGIQCICESY